MILVFNSPTLYLAKLDYIYDLNKLPYAVGKMVVALAAALILTLLLPNVLAQPDDLSSILENAQKSLDTKGNNTSTTAQSIITTKPTIPINADLYLESTLIYDPSYEDWNFPEDAKFNFVRANKICPQKDCAQEFEKVSLWWTGSDEFMISGTLKVEDKSARDPDFRSWKYYEPTAWAIKITNVKEEIRTNQTTYSFDGLLGIGIHGGLSNPDMLFKIIGTFQEPAGLLKFSGKETTQDQFFQSRSAG